MKKKLTTFIMALALVFALVLPGVVSASRPSRPTVPPKEEPALPDGEDTGTGVPEGGETENPEDTGPPELPEGEPAEKTTQLVIHKILMPEVDFNNHVSKDYDVTTGITDLTQHFGANAKEIDGVYFVVVPVEDTTSIALADKGDFSFVATYDDSLKGLTTGTGLQLPDIENGDYKIYEVKELSTYRGPEKELLAKSKAIPMTISLPMLNEAGDQKLTVHLYPKNTESGPTITKSVTDLQKKSDSFNINERHKWFISSIIPEGIEEYKVFRFTDVLDKALDIEESLSTVNAYIVEPNATNVDNPIEYLTVEGGTSAAIPDFSVTWPIVKKPTPENLGTEADRTITFDFTRSETKPYNRLAKYVGKKLVIECSTKINELAVMGQAIPNTAKLEYSQSNTQEPEVKISDSPEVHTGGKRFRKQDLETGGPLAGAEFIIINSATGEDGLTLNTEYGWSPLKPEMVLVSGDDGYFEVKGLKDGTYTLYEKKAPDGYAYPDKGWTFTVDGNSYYINPEAIGEELEQPENIAAPMVVNNTLMTIPLTGGIGTIIFTVGGLLLMAGAFFAIKRRRSED